MPGLLADLEAALDTEDKTTLFHRLHETFQGRDHYALFGLPIGRLSDEQRNTLRRDFFKLSRIIHPDKNNENDDLHTSAENLFKFANEAYETLFDQDKETDYLFTLRDREAAASASAHAAAASTAPPSVEPGTRLTRDEFIDLYRRGCRDFSGVDLSDVDFGEHFRFVGINFTDANLNRIKAPGAHFIDCNFTNTQLVAAELPRAVFEADYAENYEAKRDKPLFNNTNFQRANLHGACFKLDKTLFPNPDHSMVLNDVNFKNANLSRAYFEKVIFIGDTCLQGASLVGALWREGRRSLYLAESVLVVGNTLEEQSQFVRDFITLFTAVRKGGIFLRSIHEKLDLPSDSVDAEIAIAIMRRGQEDHDENRIRAERGDWFRVNTRFFNVFNQLTAHFDNDGSYHPLGGAAAEAHASALPTATA